MRWLILGLCFVSFACQKTIHEARSNPHVLPLTKTVVQVT